MVGNIKGVGTHRTETQHAPTTRGGTQGAWRKSLGKVPIGTGLATGFPQALGISGCSPGIKFTSTRMQSTAVTKQSKVIHFGAGTLSQMPKTV